MVIENKVKNKIKVFFEKNAENFLRKRHFLINAISVIMVIISSEKLKKSDSDIKLFESYILERIQIIDVKGKKIKLHSEEEINKLSSSEKEELNNLLELEEELNNLIIRNDSFCKEISLLSILNIKSIMNFICILSKNNILNSDIIYAGKTFLPKINKSNFKGLNNKTSNLSIKKFESFIIELEEEIKKNHNLISFCRKYMNL